MHIFAPDGSRIGQIRLPEICSNVCFGGTKRNRLFMTASQSLYAVYVETQARTSHDRLLLRLADSVANGPPNPLRSGTQSRYYAITSFSVD